MRKISAFVVCYNEEASLGQALESLAAVADEIIVVDNGSADGTAGIARRWTPRVELFPRSARQSFADLRNFALSLCSHDWVFYLDADERCSPELIAWLRAFKALPEEGEAPGARASPSGHPLGSAKPGRVDMYEIRRLEHFMGHPYRYGSGNPSHQWRLFRREGARFAGLVHEYPVFEGEIRRAEEPILHFPRSGPESVFEKLNRYTSLEAQSLFERGVVRPASYMLFSGLAMFWKAYFRKQGFRDGGIGLFLAVTDGVSFFLRQAKLYFLNQQAGRKRAAGGARPVNTPGPGTSR